MVKAPCAAYRCWKNVWEKRERYQCARKKIKTAIIKIVYPEEHKSFQKVGEGKQLFSTLLKAVVKETLMACINCRARERSRLQIGLSPDEQLCKTES